MSDLQPPDLLRLGDEHVRRQWMVTNGADSKEADKWFKDQLITKLEKQYNRKIRDVPQSKLPFLVRQSLTAGVTYLRQAESIKHLQSKRAKEKEHRRFDRGFRGTEGFVETLKGKYINAIRGWRIAFKDDVLEPVGFAQFMNGCRKIGYIGNVKSLWNHLLSQPDPIRGSSGDDHLSGGQHHSQHQSRSRAGAANSQPLRQTISFFDVDPLSVRKLHSFACMVEDSGREEGGLNFAQLWSKYANAGGAMRYETFYEFFCSCAETFNRNRTAAKFQDSRPEDASDAEDGEDNGNAQNVMDAYAGDPNLAPLTDPKIDSKVVFGALNFEFDCVIDTDEFLYLVKFLNLKRLKKKEPHNLHAFRRSESLQMRRAKERDWYLESQFKKMNFFVHNVDDFLAASLADQFREMLSTRCGSVVVGWRVYLDPESRGYITYSEFLGGCRRLGIAENLYIMWCDILGIDHLEDVAKGLPPKKAGGHGSAKDSTSIGGGKQGSTTGGAAAAPSPGEKLKQMLASPPALPSPADWSPRLRNSGSSISPQRLRSLPHLSGVNKAGNGDRSAADSNGGAGNSSPSRANRRGPSPPGSPPRLSDLLAQLKSSPRGGAEVMPKTSEYWLGVDIRSADFRKRKRYLDRHNKTMSLMLYHLDDRADFLLTRFSELIREYSLEDVWTVLDPKNMVSISSREFVDQCRELGFTKKEGKDLFQCLDIHGADLLTMEELSFLEKWNFPREEQDADVARGNVATHAFKYTQQRHSKRRMRNIHMTYMNLQNSTHKKMLAAMHARSASDASPTFTERQLDLRKHSMLQD